MEKWAYLIINVSYSEERELVVKSVSANYQRVLSNIARDELHDYLNGLSKEGWKLANVDVAKDGLTEAYYFKRLGEENRETNND